MPSTNGWTLQDWQAAYKEGQTPGELLPDLVGSLDRDDTAWIATIDSAGLERALADLAVTLGQAGGNPQALPLYGVPFAIKDNIDATGFATTAGCPAFAYTPEQDAVAVARLRAAGAVLIGKTNLDQFATGLVGTRSPYGAVANTFKPEVICGGSSAGSASVVARGLVPFALGTDTAGSGRVPAGLNNLVGLKPTRGACSIEGVVPACRSLDCVSVLALTVGDAATVAGVLEGYQPSDPFSRKAPSTSATLAALAALVTPTPADDGPAIRRPGEIRRLAIPATPQWFGDGQSAAAWNTTLHQWRQQEVTLVPLDFAPLFELAALLYDGPWIAERYAAIEPFITKHGDAMNPVVRGIINNAKSFSAIDTFRSQYRREELVRRIDELLVDVDALLVPTVPMVPTIEQVHADPVALNSRLGTYTNFVNLADFCALAVPAGFRDDGLPFGITLISGAWKDADLQRLASRWLNAHPTPLGATDRPRISGQA